MKTKTAAFDEAHASLRRLGVPDLLPVLHAAGVSISHSILGGSHSVAIYPPIDSFTPVDPAGVVDTVRFGGEVSLYVHVPFCETQCTFCHYVVSRYAGRGKGTPDHDDQVAYYLDALKQELRFWGAQLARSATGVSSIYIGGGTPLLLEREALHNLISAIKDEYNILPGTEVCIEGSPLTITAAGGEEKLRFLKEQGITRLSFGVQSFDDVVLKYAGRGYKREVPMRACMIANEIFENWNLDLIQGLYKGSPLEVWENLKVIAEVRPAHLTWYHGRFADRPQGDWYKMKSRRASFEDESAILLGRMLIWQEMAALGYRQTDGNRFARNNRYTDPFKKIRTSASSDLLGVGAGSYSHIGTTSMNGDCRGYVFRNESLIPAYVDSVVAGNIPITTGRRLDEEELLAMSYATGLRNGRVEDGDLRSIRDKKRELTTLYQELVNKLSDIGVLEPYVNEDGKPGVRISKLGKLFEDEVLALFFSPAVKGALGKKYQGNAKPVLSSH